MNWPCLQPGAQGCDVRRRKQRKNSVRIRRIQHCFHLMAVFRPIIQPVKKMGMNIRKSSEFLVHST